MKSILVLLLGLSCASVHASQVEGGEFFNRDRVSRLAKTFARSLDSGQIKSVSPENLYPPGVTLTPGITRSLGFGQTRDVSSEFFDDSGYMGSLVFNINPDGIEIVCERIRRAKLVRPQRGGRGLEDFKQLDYQGKQVIGKRSFQEDGFGIIDHPQGGSFILVDLKELRRAQGIVDPQKRLELSTVSGRELAAALWKVRLEQIRRAELQWKRVEALREREANKKLRAQAAATIRRLNESYSAGRVAAGLSGR